MAKRRKNSQFIQVKVLQGGIELSEMYHPVGKRGILRLSSKGDGPLSIPYYPFPDGQVEFIATRPGSTRLIVNYKWEGFTTSRGHLINIDRRVKGSEEIELHKGDYGSISYKDIRIMFKIDSRRPDTDSSRGTKDKAHRASLIDLAFPHRLERQNLGWGIAASLVLFGCLAYGLLSVKFSKPKTMLDLPDEYILPFVDADFFSTAPEKLQDRLKRPKIIAPVVNHYTSIAALMLGWDAFEEADIFSPTIDTYIGLHRESRSKIEGHLDEQQRSDASTLTKKNTGILLIPTVLGESIEGQILRTTDKMNIMHASLKENLELKKTFTKEYRDYQRHQFEEYKDTRLKSTKGLGMLQNIKPWDRRTDEESMYLEAEAVRIAAVNARYNIEASIAPDDRLDPIAENPVGMPKNFKFGTFSTDFDFGTIDDKLYTVDASTFGKASPKKLVAKEPLTGEIDPKLIENHIIRQQFQLQQCYELALRRNEKAQGKVEWSWRIDTRGKISDIALLHSAIKDQKMTACMRKRIASWRFPRPRRGSVKVDFPFEFYPAKG